MSFNSGLVIVDLVASLSPAPRASLPDREERGNSSAEGGLDS